MKKILSDQDPIINDYFSGPATTDNWNAFVNYLKDKHGRTMKEKASSIIEGTEREGRTPSQLWSVMVDKAGNATLADIMKEQLLRRLPQDVRRHLRNRMEGNTGKQVAKMADEYYEEGKLLDNSYATGINAVRPSALENPDRLDSRPASRQAPRQQSRHLEAGSFTPAFDDDNDDGSDTEINAVRFCQGQKQSFKINNHSGRSASRGPSHNSSSRNYNSNDQTRSSSRYNDNDSAPRANKSKPDSKVCYYHTTYGDKARSCAEGSMLYSKHQVGNGKASR